MNNKIKIVYLTAHRQREGKEEEGREEEYKATIQLLESPDYERN